MNVAEREAKIDFILEHYENPRHHGRLPEPCEIQRGGNPGCGDILTLYLQIDGRGIVTDVSFEGEGCTISQAAASMVTELVLGKSVAEIQALPSDTVLDLVGREIASTRLRCATLGLNVAKTAALAWQNRQTDSNTMQEGDRS